MNTTEPFQVSKTLMFDRSSAVRSPRGVTARGALSTRCEQPVTQNAPEPSTPSESTRRIKGRLDRLAFMADTPGLRMPGKMEIPTDFSRVGERSRRLPARGEQGCDTQQRNQSTRQPQRLESPTP